MLGHKGILLEFRLSILLFGLTAIAHVGYGAATGRSRNWRATTAAAATAAVVGLQEFDGVGRGHGRAGHHAAVLDKVHLAEVVAVGALRYERGVTERTLEQGIIDNSLIAGPREGKDGTRIRGRAKGRSVSVGAPIGLGIGSFARFFLIVVAEHLERGQGVTIFLLLAGGSRGAGCRGWRYQSRFGLPFVLRFNIRIMVDIRCMTIIVAAGYRATGGLVTRIGSSS